MEFQLQLECQSLRRLKVKKPFSISVCYRLTYAGLGGGTLPTVLIFLTVLTANKVPARFAAWGKFA